MPDIRVIDINSDNIEAVLDVQAKPDQQAWVRPVAWYVARSAYHKVWTPVALSLGDEIVGFAEWAYDDSDATHCIGGLILDARRQGQGYGKAVVRALVAHLRQRPDCGTIALAVDEDNVRARGLYRSLGFIENGDHHDRELVMVLTS